LRDLSFSGVASPAPTEKSRTIGGRCAPNLVPSKNVGGINPAASIVRAARRIHGIRKCPAACRATARWYLRHFRRQNYFRVRVGEIRQRVVAYDFRERSAGWTRDPIGRGGFPRLHLRWEFVSENNSRVLAERKRKRESGAFDRRIADASGKDSILIFGTGAKGNVKPKAVVIGSKTQLNAPTDLTIRQ
jgi:hypothetical protein